MKDTNNHQPISLAEWRRVRAAGVETKVIHCGGNNVRRYGYVLDTAGTMIRTELGHEWHIGRGYIPTKSTNSTFDLTRVKCSRNKIAYETHRAARVWTMSSADTGLYIAITKCSACGYYHTEHKHKNPNVSYWLCSDGLDSWVEVAEFEPVFEAIDHEVISGHTIEKDARLMQVTFLMENKQ